MVNTGISSDRITGKPLLSFLYTVTILIRNADIVGPCHCILFCLKVSLIPAAIFSQGHYLYFLLIFAHLWWFGSWGIGVGVLDCFFGVGISVDGASQLLNQLDNVTNYLTGGEFETTPRALAKFELWFCTRGEQ